MAQYEAKLLSLGRDAVPPPSLPDPLCGKTDMPADPNADAEDEAEDAAIIAARLGGVDRFD